MTWPADDLTTVHLDSETDSVAAARTELLAAVNKIKAILAELPAAAVVLSQAMADARYVNVAGDTMTGSFSINPGGTANAGFEHGSTGGASTPVIDFHSGAAPTDYDSRIIASGGTGSDGGGALNIEAASLKHNGNTLWHAGNDGAGSGLDSDTVDGVGVLKGSVGIAEQTIAPGGVFEVTFSVPGAATGMPAVCGGYDDTAIWDANITAFVPAANQVTCRFQNNNTSVPIHLPAQTVKAVVFSW